MLQILSDWRSCPVGLLLLYWFIKYFVDPHFWFRQCNSPPTSSSPPTSTSMGGNSSSSSGLVGGIRLLDSFQHSSNSSSHHSSLPSHQTSSSSSNSSGNYMQQCSIVSCTNSAVARCLTCHTNLCSACVNTHLVRLSWSRSKMHIFLSISLPL